MNITIPVFLLLLFVVLYWLIKESNLKLWVKIISIVISFSFCLIFWSSANSLFGWAAQNALPENGIVTIRHITIKEPNPVFNIKGGIYLLLEYPPPKYDSIILQVFGYKVENSEPRLIIVPYSRKLHEELEKGGAMEKLKNGQLIRGRLTKGPPGKGENKEKGNGDESQDDHEMHFYQLKPSYFQQKPPR